MTLEMLLAQFDGLIQTPADVEKLNATILQWAVQGRLLPNKNDQKPESLKSQNILDIETSFKIPSGWKWVRLDKIADFINGDRGKNYPNKREYVSEGVPFINAGHIDPRTGRVSPDSMNFITRQKFNALRSGKIQQGDLLYCLRGALGKTALIQNWHEGAIASSLVIIRPYGEIFADFLYNYLISPVGSAEIKKYDNGSAQPNLSVKSLKKFLVPLPPLAEQKRIVVRVDELLGQTAVLTQQLESVNEQRRGVHTAVLHQLTQPANQPTDVFPLLSRNFDRLYVDADTIAELKQAILQLAVQGRLVPQDEKDEDAAVLLERIEEEKKLLISQTEGRDENAFISLSNGKFTHSLPKNWKWTKVGEVCPYIVPNRDKPKSFTGDIPWITLPDFDEELYLYGSKEGLGLTKEEVNKYRARTVPAGSVIMSCIGRFGIIGILKQDSVINQQLHAFLVPKSVDARYLVYALRTQTSYMESQATSTTILYLNKSKCNSVPFPLPPYQEQKRIVAKVDELFALCDQLAGQVTAAENGREQLLEAVLAQAT